MKTPFKHWLTTTFLCCIFLICGLQAANRVVLKAEASDDFVKARALNKEDKIMTYQFMKGRYHGGTTKDSGMGEISFDAVLHDLAMNLRMQGFYMHKDRSQGDMLIVVHYGATDYEISFEEMMGYTNEEDMGLTEDILNAGAGGEAIDIGTIDAMQSLDFTMRASQNMQSGNQQSAYYKAQLLGMERAYSEQISSTEEYELKSMLDEERYYIVLMAYDYPQFKKGERNLLWTTRYSIRTLGQSFAEAVQDMNLIAGDYFGKNLKGLNKKRVSDKSRVEMGDIEVIGTGEEETTN